MVKQTAGIKISQPGYDVNLAADYNLLFNSSWVSLQVIKEFTQVMTPTFDGTWWNFSDVAFTHNLGFYAFADLWETNNINNTGSIKTIRNNGKLDLGNNDVLWHGDTFITGQPNPITVSIKVYNLDISKQFEYEYIQPPTTKRQYDPTFGMKIVKYGKSIGSTDLRDFILHTRTQSPALLTVRTEKDVDANGNITFTNLQNYTNWIYGYWKGSHSVRYSLIPQQSQSYPKYTFVNGSTYTAALTAGDRLSLVVLRDPLIVAEKVNVVY
jgi:hypothetical protein